MLDKITQYGGELVPLRHNMVAVLSAQVKKMAKERGWQMSFDAFNHPVYVKSWKERSASFFQENDYQTLVIQGGSGVTGVGLIQSFLGVDYIAGQMFEPTYDGKKVIIISTSSVKTEVCARVKYGKCAFVCVEIYKSEHDFYDEIPTHTTPFPCNRLWDKKAWVWMTQNVEELKGRTLFWNLGA